MHPPHNMIASMAAPPAARTAACTAAPMAAHIHPPCVLLGPQPPGGAAHGGQNACKAQAAGGPLRRALVRGQASQPAAAPHKDLPQVVGVAAQLEHACREGVGQWAGAGRGQGRSSQHLLVLQAARAACMCSTLSEQQVCVTRAGQHTQHSDAVPAHMCTTGHQALQHIDV
jgi:hypothetical protein